MLKVQLPDAAICPAVSLMPRSPPVAVSVPAVLPSQDSILLPAPHGGDGDTDGVLSVLMPDGKRSVKDSAVIADESLLVMVTLIVAMPVVVLKLKLLSIVGVALTTNVSEAATVLLLALLVVTAPMAIVLV